MTEAQRRLAAIVAADIAGFSRLIGMDEEGTLAAQREDRANLFDPLAYYFTRGADEVGGTGKYAN